MKEKLYWSPMENAIWSESSCSVQHDQAVGDGGVAKLAPPVVLDQLGM